MATDAAVCTNLPKTATTLPTYIARGDADMLVSTAWSTEAIAKMCALGTPVHDLVVPGGHDAPGAVADQWLNWIGDLFDGTPWNRPARADRFLLRQHMTGSTFAFRMKVWALDETPLDWTL